MYLLLIILSSHGHVLVPLLNSRYDKRGSRRLFLIGQDVQKQNLELQSFLEHIVRIHYKKEHACIRPSKGVIWNDERIHFKLHITLHS